MLDRHALTIDEFRKRLDESDLRLEFLDGLVLDFAGGTAPHSLLSTNIIRALSSAVQPPCRVYTADMAVAVTDRAYVFPDATVSCEPITASLTELIAPIVIVEVVSASSVQRDRAEKLDLYQAMSSVREYCLIDSRRRWTCVFRRAGSQWSEVLVVGSNSLVLESVALSLPLDELYANVPVLD